MAVRWEGLNPHWTDTESLREARREHEELRQRTAEVLHEYGDLLAVAARIDQLARDRHQNDALTELCEVLPGLVLRERISQGSRGSVAGLRWWTGSRR